MVSYQDFPKALPVHPHYFNIHLCRIVFLTNLYSVLTVFVIFALWLFPLFPGTDFYILLQKISNIQISWKKYRFVYQNTHHLYSTVNPLPYYLYHASLLLFICHPFLFNAFQSKLPTSLYFLPCTSTCLAWTKVQYLLTGLFFEVENYIQWNTPIFLKNIFIKI